MSATVHELVHNLGVSRAPRAVHDADRGRHSAPAVSKEVRTGNPSSLPTSQRIPTLDIVRGFALLGILIMNMPGFSSSFFAEADGSHLWPGAVDQFAEELRNLLFSGKFNSMFSLLFGIGFTIQFERMKKLDPQHAEGL